MSEVGLKLPGKSWLALVSLLWQRFRLKWNPLNLDAAAQEVSPRDLATLNTCWTAVAGLSVVDPIRAAVLVAVATTAGGQVRGYEPTELVTFAFVSQGFIMVVGVFGDRELSQRIRTGDIVIDLYRPADLQVWWLAVWLGNANRLSLPWLNAAMERTIQAMGADYWSYGFAANRAELDADCRYSVEQHLSGRRVQPEDLFPTAMLET